MRDAVKRADPAILADIAKRIRSLVQAGEFPGFFGPDTTLIPVPGRAPRRSADTLWVPERICQELQRVGLAREIWPALRRAHVVPKSAFAAPGERPALQTHLDSLALTSAVPPTGKLLLVDDFVTKGRTLLAAAQTLSQSMPQVEVRAFAVVRTMGLVPDVDRILWPIVGEIRLEQDDAVREP